MSNDRGIIMLLSLGAIWLLASQTASANIPSYDNQMPDVPGGNPMPADTLPPVIDSGASSLDQKISAFLGVIGKFESNNQYDVMAGTSERITDFSWHPGIIRNVTINGIVYPTSASGKYQITKGTWKDFAPIAGVSDFTPPSQDAVAYEILRSTGAFDYLAADDIEGAFKAASGRWSSLPGSGAHQNPQSLNTALNVFFTLLG
jgi:muramidase (phage lysozyme)